MVSWIAACVLPLSLVAANAEQLKWHDNYGTALNVAKEQAKPLLVILENPNDDARRVTQVAFRSEETSAELLRPYVLCRVDVTTEYGQRVARAFNADEVPHVSIIDKTGQVQIFKQSGPFTTEQWQATLTAHRAGNRKTAATMTYSTRSYGTCVNCR